MHVLERFETLPISADILNDAGIPSASIAVLGESGHVDAHVITHGSENPETLYQACSISKAITALAVAKLVDEKKISYDTKVVDHVPRHVLEGIGKTESWMEYVTVGLLVSHRAGLSQGGFPGYVGAIPSAEQIILGQPPSNTPRIRFLSPPGSQWSYSGAGYVLLQIFLEHVIGLPFGEIMQKTVLGPLHMTRSRYGDLPAHEQNFARAYYTAFVPATEANGGFHRFPELAAAGLWTTPSDLLKAVAAIQASLHTDTGFISTETAKVLLTAVEPNSPRAGMARGWGADGAFFGHSGHNDPGYMTYVFASHGGAVNSGRSGRPKNVHNAGRGAVAIMTNSAYGFAAIQKIVAAIFSLNAWRLVRSLPGSFGSMTDFVPLAAPEGTGIPDFWKDWVGQWGDDWELCNVDGAPQLAFGHDRPPMPLRPAALPSTLADGTREWTLVVEGLEIALRFTLQDDEKVLQVVQENVVSLRRKESSSSP